MTTEAGKRWYGHKSGIIRSHQKPGELGRILPRNFWRKLSPADSLTLDFWAPECERMNSGCFKPPCVALSHGGPREQDVRALRVHVKGKNQASINLPHDLHEASKPLTAFQKWTPQKSVLFRNRRPAHPSRARGDSLGVKASGVRPAQQKRATEAVTQVFPTLLRTLTRKISYQRLYSSGRRPLDNGKLQVCACQSYFLGASLQIPLPHLKAQGTWYKMTPLPSKIYVATSKLRLLFQRSYCVFIFPLLY